MFKDNQYTKQYYEIIDLAKHRGGQYRSRYLAKKNLGYIESHHIIPSSIGGSDDLENRAWLTAYEHLKCHLLLTEMCENEGHRHKMLLADTRMMNKQDNRREREKLLPLQITEEDMQWLAKIREDSAEAHSKYVSEKHKGEKNPFYGKKHTEESTAKRRLWSTVNNPMSNPESVAKLAASKRDPKIYHWIHKSGETFVGTRHEFLEKYGPINMYPLFKTDAKKTCHGWSLKTTKE